MKTLILSFIFTAATAIAFGQDNPGNAEFKYFIVLYTTGENWDTAKQVFEQPFFIDHSSHLAELRKEKRIDIGGRYSDTGMILLKAKDETEAHNLITKDIAIQRKLFKAQIFSFDAFYSGCIE